MVQPYENKLCELQLCYVCYKVVQYLPAIIETASEVQCVMGHIHVAFHPYLKNRWRTDRPYNGNKERLSTRHFEVSRNENQLCM